jgi:branched-subunit amino acid transport protein
MLLVLLFGGVVTLAFKGSFTLVGDRIRLPRVIDEASAYVAPAMIAALMARSFASQAGGPAGLVALPAGAVALLVASRTKSVGWTMGSGIGAYVAVAVVSGTGG